MNKSKKLIPVSFHLRNFNLYRKLDLPVSNNGNLALVGENGVGKTTLANCFFPMLVDGSIATPSFNPTTDTGKLSNSINPRNSSQDSRTFDAMLLGWGSSAMKVRTGYAYEKLSSKYRDVILGIGAYRANGDPRSRTWWFVATNEDSKSNLTVITTADDGHALDKDGFRLANQSLGKQLHIFEKATDYREFVAFQIYGFTSGQELGLLAQADRMIASPMLTAGNAKFEPIRQALVNSQEKIDDEIIQKAAQLQRQVNDKQSLQARIEEALKRIDRIKQLTFLGNFNQLNKLLINPYSTLSGNVRRQQANIESLNQTAVIAKKSITTQKNSLDETEAKLTELKVNRERQKLIQSQRDQLAREIKNLERTARQYKRVSAQKEKIQAQQKENAVAAADLESSLTDVKTSQFAPLIVQIKDNLIQLKWQEVFENPDPTEISQTLTHRFQQASQLISQYQQWVSNSDNLNDAVSVFTDTKDQMSDSIDRHVTGLRTDIMKEQLHNDNRSIHDTGAGKISDKFKMLKQQIADLLAQHPEIKAMLSQPELLPTLKQQTINLEKIGKQLNQLGQRHVTIQNEKVSLQKQLDTLLEAMDSEFNFEDNQHEIESLKGQLSSLQIDPTIDDQIQQNQREYDGLKRQIDRSQAQLTGAHAKIESFNQQIDDEKREMQQLGQRMTEALDQLQPYLPVDAELTGIETATTYLIENQAMIRNNPIVEMSDRIGHMINRSTDDRMDRQAVNTLFNELGYSQIADQMFPHTTETMEDVVLVAFDVDEAFGILKTELTNVQKMLQQIHGGANLAVDTYKTAVIQRITAQYHSVQDFNQMLSEGTADSDGIKIKIELVASKDVDGQVIKEAVDPSLDAFPALDQEIDRRLAKLATDPDLADDEAMFVQKTDELLDTRNWSEFVVKIKRRQSDEDHYEIVDDRFVRSGGSGAEKAQAMVLPLLLVPKMILNRSAKADAPYVVMFDEFADKLDPETARIFAKTINKFGFSFIATMPSGAQSKLLSDGVDNITYQVIAPQNRNDGKFHVNQVKQAYTWGA